MSYGRTEAQKEFNRLAFEEFYKESQEISKTLLEI